VAHQLRAPMTQLRWIVEQMLEEKKIPKAFEGPLAQLQEIVLAENQFVGDLLNVSRIERGVLKLEKKAVPVTRLLEAIITPLRQAAQARHIKLVLTKPLDASVYVDEEKTVQALRNVVDNAIKYSKEWTSVSIGATASAGQAVITIADQGPGIRSELRDKLYEIKTEISPDATSTTGSTGLGLYLTKKFVDAMDGSVDFKTGSKGTTFVIHLPLA
jgi:signal transduction histidine kinase